MDGEIEFGDLQHVPPRTARRPDADLHFVVAPYGQPVDGELPVFVDLDVMREIEDHAASDTSVELGGVLLGGQFEDADGRPFVVITDCLRAQHYESTKGSFKFTHETWEAITRQRDEFPEELQMVGWYHTHPDWGVFLSGMDMFICDHFFNKLLDVAYVVDPCRGDRGMFQWTRDSRQRTRRTSGFYVTASRFREDELQQFVSQLSQRGPSMPSLPHGSGGSPIIHVTQPQPPAWQGVAVWGTMAAQFCLIALIAWRMLAPNAGMVGDASVARGSGAPEDTKAAMQTEFVDRVLRELRGTEEGFAERMEKEFARTSEIEAELQVERRQNIALLRDIDLAHKDLKNKFESLERKLAVRDEELTEALTKNKELAGKLAAIDKSRQAKKKSDAAETDTAEGFPVTYIVGGGVGVLALVFLGLAFFWRRGSQDIDEEPDSFRSRRPSADGARDTNDEPDADDQPLRTAPQSKQ